MLHTVNQLPVELSFLESISFGDTILFTGNAIYAAKKNKNSLNLLQQAFKHLNFCVLSNDVIKQGLSFNEILNRVTIIDEKDYRHITKNNIAIKSCN